MFSSAHQSALVKPSLADSCPFSDFDGITYGVAIIVPLAPPIGEEKEWLRKKCLLNLEFSNHEAYMIKVREGVPCI